MRNLRKGGRVLIPSTISWGFCSYCRAGYTAQYDNANPDGAAAGTAFFGGPKMSGPFQGLQAQYARTPLANASLVRLPDEIDDDRAVLMSDIFPTGYFGAQLAGVRTGDTVAVFGAGPVGQFAVASAKLMGAGRVIVVARIASRRDMVCTQGADVINVDEEDPVDIILQLTGEIDVHRVIDAVGVDAVRAEQGPAAEKEKTRSRPSTQRSRSSRHKPGPTAATGSRAAVRRRFCRGPCGPWRRPARIDHRRVSANRPHIPDRRSDEPQSRPAHGQLHHRAITPRLVELVRNGSFDPLGG